MTSEQEARLLRLWGLVDLNNQLTVREEYVPFVRMLTTSLGWLCRSRHHLHTKDNGRQSAAGRQYSRLAHAHQNSIHVYIARHNVSHGLVLYEARH